LTIALTALLLGCSSTTPWHVLQQSHPNPMTSQDTFVVMPLDYSYLHVGKLPEDDYLARKDEEFRDKWRSDKKAMNAEFTGELVAQALEHGVRVAVPPAEAPFVIHPQVTRIDRGFFRGITHRDSRLKVVAHIVAADGTVVDQIRLSETVYSTWATATVQVRLRLAARQLGKHVAEYLQERVDRS
jgi:hypothetical protein